MLSEILIISGVIAFAISFVSNVVFTLIQRAAGKNTYSGIDFGSCMFWGFVLWIALLFIVGLKSCGL